MTARWWFLRRSGGAPTPRQLERMTGIVFPTPGVCEACGCRLPRGAVSYCNADCAISDGVSPEPGSLGVVDAELDAWGRVVREQEAPMPEPFWRRWKGTR